MKDIDTVSAFSYAPAPESPEIARLKPAYGIFVNGQFTNGRGEAVKTINPANEQPLAEFGHAGRVVAAGIEERHDADIVGDLDPCLSTQFEA